MTSNRPQIDLQDLTSKQLTSKDVTSKELPSKDLTSKDLTSKELTSKDLTSKQLTSKEFTSRDSLLPGLVCRMESLQILLSDLLCPVCKLGVIAEWLRFWLCWLNCCTSRTDVYALRIARCHTVTNSCLEIRQQRAAKLNVRNTVWQILACFLPTKQTLQDDILLKLFLLASTTSLGATTVTLAIERIRYNDFVRADLI